MKRAAIHAGDRRLRMLLRWFERQGRNLPWRRTRDPYRILVSEVMLQQTPVARVIPYYGKWIKRFPNWEALANAKTSELIRAWAGLGYNRRALYLRDAARRVITDGVPKTIGDWRTLPGVGPYTAAAVYAFSQRRGALAIDTNVRRVTGRIFFGIPYPTIAHDARIGQALEAAFRGPEGWKLLHALMDLGAMVCHSDQPDCETCPIGDLCRAAPKFLSGSARKPRAPARERRHEGKRHPDRIYRGRILALVRENGSMRVDTIGKKIDERFDSSRDASWLERMIDRLVQDRLLVRRTKNILLPD